MAASTVPATTMAEMNNMEKAAVPGATLTPRTQTPHNAKAAANDLLPLREQEQRARQDGLDLLAAPAVDRAAIERLRTAQIALADQASKRIAQAIADVADVLTPEQRKALAERISQGPWSRWHHRG